MLNSQSQLKGAMNPMTTLTFGAHRRWMLLAGVVLLIVVFFASRRAASFTDRPAPVALALSRPTLPPTALPKTLHFTLADVVSYFTTALATKPSVSENRFVFTGPANGYPEDVFRIEIFEEAQELVVAFSGGGDYGLTMAREFFEARFFTRDETLRFFTLLEESREGPVTAKLPRFTVRFTHIGHRDDFHLTLRFTAAAS